MSDLERDFARLKRYSAALEDEIKILRSALEKYASGKHYIGCSDAKEPFEFQETEFGLDEMPIGWLARQTLKGLKK